MTQYERSIDSRHRSMMLDLIRFYDDAQEADGIIYASAAEIEDVRFKTRELLAQFSAVTATWGLSDWERVLDLPPRPNSSDDVRRARILAKLRGTAPATLANMLAIVNAHVPNKDAQIIELPEPGTLIVDIPLQSDITLKGLTEDLNTYKPAHLAFEVYGTIADVLRISERFYSFEIANLICNCFTTDNAHGIGVFTQISASGRGYEFDVDYPITNVLSTQDARGIGVIAESIEVQTKNYDVSNPYLLCGNFYAEEEN